MAHIHELIRQVAATDADLAARLKREYDTLANRRAFGLNFERHTPEAVELPGRPVRRGDKVHILPPRGETVKAENNVLWVVTEIDRKATPPIAQLIRDAGNEGNEECQVVVEDLVVVAEFRDPIYPGLVSTGSVERGGDKPFHSVINGENFHALQALLFTHRGKIDAVYIDPPYNTGARDWKYNNDYVEAEDHYRHSKWLAFIERRLLLAKELLNPEDSVLIVTIDEKEYLRLGLLLEQVFPGARIQMISSVIKPGGVSRPSGFSRSDEYIYVVMQGKCVPKPVILGQEWFATARGKTSRGKVHWNQLYRRGADGIRAYSPGCYFPVFVRRTATGSMITGVGRALEPTESRSDFTDYLPDSVAVWPPNRPSGDEGRWSTTPEKFCQLVELGFAKAGRFSGDQTPIYFLSKGERDKTVSGEYRLSGKDENGVATLDDSAAKPSFVPTSQWNIPSHDASRHGSNLLSSILDRRHFPYPKSLYAVEDVLWFFLSTKPDAVVLDFFAGSGTTAHATIRLNRRDRGRRISISITNNEVSAEEQKNLRREGLRQGDAAWERHGICDFITKPRVRAVIEGITPEGKPIQGSYKFTDEFPMAEGFEENVEFWTLTYEMPLSVTSGRAFDRVAPLLWMKAGSKGRIIAHTARGWDVAEYYGVLVDLDKTVDFIGAISGAESTTHAFIVTDEDRLFEAVVRELPSTVEPVRLYDSYLRNSEFDSMVSA